MRGFSTLFVLAAGLLLTACANPSLENLRATAPKGSPFQSQLAARYLGYAEQLERDGATDRSIVFADKGLTAAYGQDPAAEIPADGMEDAAKTLQALLDSKPASERSREMADAQFYYDCWVDQTALDGQDAGFCKEKFEAATKGITPVAEKEEGIEGEETEAVTAEGEVHAKQLSYLVYFALNRAELNEAAKRTVEAILADLKGKEKIDIVVSGHTDTSGADKYNMQLSLKRAEVVRKALIAMGVAESAIRTFGYGESDPVVPTGDEVIEPKNRRAEIVVN